MKTRTYVLILNLLLSAAAYAQLPANPAIEAADSLKTSEPSDAPAGIGTETGTFASGLGVSVDTLDISDGRLKIVLRDDHTWYYIKNIELIAQDSVFTQNWQPNVLNAYSSETVDKLPYRNIICLVDSVSTFACPYQRAVYSKFGYRRGRQHQGVDLPLPTGTPVKAAFDGCVRASTYTSGYGNLVIIRHENGLETYYGHLSKREVEVGDWVSAGQVIGLGGSTGRSTGPHLHFETRWHGFAFDPQWIINFEEGKLRANVFVLRRTYLDPRSQYVHQDIEEEEDIYKTEEEIEAEEKRIAAERAAMKWHTVKNGDTVSAIAHKYGVSMNKIKDLNPGINLNKIRIGQKIRVN